MSLLSWLHGIVSGLAGFLLWKLRATDAAGLGWWLLCTVLATVAETGIVAAWRAQIRWFTAVRNSVSERVAKVVRSYRKKAAKHNARLADAAAPQVDWREMMYEAFVRQSGHDPREFVRQPESGPEPEPNADVAASRPASPQPERPAVGAEPTPESALGPQLLGDENTDRSLASQQVGTSRPVSPNREVTNPRTRYCSDRPAFPASLSKPRRISAGSGS